MSTGHPIFVTNFAQLMQAIFYAQLIHYLRFSCYFLSNIKISSLPKCSYSREYIKRRSAELTKVLHINAQNGPLWLAWQQATFEAAFSSFHGPFTIYRLLLKGKLVTSEEKHDFLISNTYALMTSIWFSE